MGSKRGKILALSVLLSLVVSCSADLSQYKRIEENAGNEEALTKEMRHPATESTHENNKVHSEENLALEIEATDMAKNKKQAIEHLQSKLRAEATKKAAVTAPKEPRTKELEKMKPESKQLHWGKTGKIGAKEMKSIARDAYNEYHQNMKIAKHTEAVRKTKFEQQRKEAREKSTVVDGPLHFSFSDNSDLDTKKKSWQIALANRDKAAEKQHKIFQEELKKAKQLMKQDEAKKRKEQSKAAAHARLAQKHSKESKSKVVNAHTTVSSVKPHVAAQVKLQKATEEKESLEQKERDERAKKLEKEEEHHQVSTRTKLKEAVKAVHHARKAFLHADSMRVKAESQLEHQPHPKGWKSILHKSPSKEEQEKQLKEQVEKAKRMVADSEKTLALAVKRQFHLEKKLELEGRSPDVVPEDL